MAEFKTIAVIVAAGKGLRMQSTRKKQFLELEGMPVLVHTLKAFDRLSFMDEMVLVTAEGDMDFCKDMISPHGLRHRVHITSGGVDRQGSVTNGLKQAGRLAEDPQKTIVLVHDGVRPFVPQDLVKACLESAIKTGAAIPALPVSDTIKLVDKGNRIQKTLDRSSLYRAQTPQAFRLDSGLSAFAYAKEKGFKGTDEASILEHAGMEVGIVPGSDLNIKLTTPDDLVLARFILSRTTPPV